VAQHKRRQRDPATQAANPIEVTKNPTG
jgi:hypothetical protein